jgi:hypothetical protein
MYFLDGGKGGKASPYLEWSPPSPHFLTVLSKLQMYYYLAAMCTLFHLNYIHKFYFSSLISKATLQHNKVIIQ